MGNRDGGTSNNGGGGGPSNQGGGDPNNGGAGPNHGGGGGPSNHGGGGPNNGGGDPNNGGGPSNNGEGGGTSGGGHSNVNPVNLIARDAGRLADYLEEGGTTGNECLRDRGIVFIINHPIPDDINVVMSACAKSVRSIDTNSHIFRMTNPNRTIVDSYLIEKLRALTRNS
jgi:hypothetical protein